MIFRSNVASRLLSFTFCRSERKLQSKILFFFNQVAHPDKGERERELTKRQNEDGNGGK